MDADYVDACCDAESGGRERSLEPLLGRQAA
jgi:hypothetical protein